MNIVLENKFEKVNKTLILLLLVLMISYSLYNVFNYKAITYHKSTEKIYIIDPSMRSSSDTIYPLTDPVTFN